MAAPERTLSRRAVLRLASTGSVAALAVGGIRSRVGRAAGESKGDQQPNIILIVLDDMRADDLAMMPIVQSRLVAQGTTFANFVAVTPGCAPARASILTGQYPHNHGLRRSGGDNGGFDKFYESGSEQSTIATWLQGAGYRTVLIGKYFNEYRQNDDPTYIPPGWSEWYGVTKEGYYGFRVNENGTERKYPRLKAYSTDLFAQQANDFIARTAPTGEPFFAYIAPRAPHNPPEPAPRHEGAFADASVPRPPSFDEADVSDKPRWVQVLPRMTADDMATTDDFYRKRLETLLAVDDLVGGLIETLDAAGALENTYIIFTSDNGYHLGEHRIVKDKGAPYEESIRMPLVVRGPGVLAGHTVNDLGSQVDLGATCAAWADATVPTVIDGRSLAPVLTQGDSVTPWRQVALVEKWADRPDHPPRPGSTRRDTTNKQPGFDALRGEAFIYVEYYTGEQEFYDLTRDPYELENLSDRADPALLAALSSRLQAMTECAGASCLQTEEAPLPDALVAFLETPETPAGQASPVAASPGNRG